MVDEAESDDWTTDRDKTEDDPEEEESPSLTYEILNYPADTTVKGYKDLWDSDQLIVPDFQRNFVWDQVKASKLIESFLIGLPVPGVFLYKARNASKYMIIDGQQRIQSLVQFQTELFGDNKFRLKKVAKPWDNKSFSELDEADRFTLESSVMRATIIQQLSPDDNSSIYQIFERLNTGGVNLNPMEVRRCVSYGPFIQLLEEVNNHPSWRNCLGSTKPDKRLRDIELILRCFAIFSGYSSYEKPMKSFLNKFAETMREKQILFPELKSKFCKACDLAQSEIGDKPFHLKNRLNYGVLDSLLVALMTHPDTSNIADKFRQLKSDDTYIQSASFNTSDASVLKQRIEKALEAFSNTNA